MSDDVETQNAKQTEPEIQSVPKDRIKAMQEKGNKPNNLAIYGGVAALVCILGAGIYINSGDGQQSDSLLIPEAEETPLERRQGGGLFGGVPADVETTEAIDVVPVDDPRFEALQNEITRLQGLIDAKTETGEAAVILSATDTSNLESELTRLDGNQARLETALREINARLRSAGGNVTPTDTSTNPGLSAEEQRRLDELKERRAAEVERLAADPILYTTGENSTSASSNPDKSGFIARSTSREVDTAYASQLINPGNLIPQGTIINSTLETAITSNLTGLIKARITHDVWSYDGTQVLIPRGSMLIGEYDSDISIGDNRIQAVWNRVITTDNKSVMIGSRAIDRLGQAGVSGQIDHHFGLKFEAAFFVSVLNRIAGTNGGQRNSNVQSGAEAAQTVGNDALSDYLAIPPSIHVQHGTEVNVFVAKDLYL